MSSFVAGVRSRMRSWLGWAHVLRRAQLPIIERLLALTPGCSLLDLGAGEGRIAERLQSQCRYVVACEPSHAVHHIRAQNNLSVVRGDGAALPFRDGSFDRVLLSSVIQMMPDARPLLREARRVLAPGGRILLTAPIGYRYLPLAFRGGRRAAALRERLSLPASFDSFRADLNRRHDSLGPGYLTVAEIAALLADAGLDVQHWEYCPRAVGTAVYESLLLAKYALGASVSVAGRWPMMLYPVAWFDRWLPPTSQGCEVAVIARSVST